ncbi:mitochondrial escape protein 2-2 [Candida albicans P37039]|nr:mitochondrial escape protein 2-2 [Candida albicans P37039]
MMPCPTRCSRTFHFPMPPCPAQDSMSVMYLRSKILALWTNALSLWEVECWTCSRLSDVSSQEKAHNRQSTR